MFAENIGKEDQVDVQLEDKADAREEHFSARDIQGRFDLLRDLSDAEMEKLNKSVVKKIDWRMMPYITIMFLMRYEILAFSLIHLYETLTQEATLTASTSPTPSWRAYRKTFT